MKIKVSFLCSLTLMVFFFFIEVDSALASEGKSERTEMIQGACSAMMYDLDKRYGKSFICHTSDSLTATGDVAVINESLHMGKSGFRLAFYNLSYDNVLGKRGGVNYSYDIKDYNYIVSLLNSGKGLTYREISFQVCKDSMIDFKVKKEKNKIDFKNKIVDEKNYKFLDTAYDEAISNYRNCALENKPDNLSDKQLDNNTEIQKFEVPAQ